MCTISEVDPKLEIAEEDIVVYKRLFDFNLRFFGLFGGTAKSIHREYSYEFGKIYETYLEQFVLDKGQRSDKDCYKSRGGFYSWADKVHDANVKCIIPKGSKYYKCEDLQSGRVVYHSNKIKIVRKLRRS